MQELLSEFKMIGMRLLGLAVLTPVMGYLFLLAFEKSEKEWKSGSRRKKWIVMCGIFFIIASIGGWLR
jgi:hypothetical protein